MSIPLFVAAAVAEIAGCFAFFAWWRNGASALWLMPGLVSLVAFAWLLALTPVDAAGRIYAAYGGIYIAAALVWLWAADWRWPTAGSGGAFPNRRNGRGC